MWTHIFEYFTCFFYLNCADKKSEAKDKQEDSEEQETDVLDDKPFNDGDQDNLEDENNESFS